MGEYHTPNEIGLFDGICPCCGQDVCPELEFDDNMKDLGYHTEDNK